MRMDHKNIGCLKNNETKICLNCEKQTVLYDLQFKHIIANFENGVLKNKDSSKYEG